MRWVKAFSVVLLSMLLAIYLVPTDTQGTGIGVINVPPAFDTISIDTTDRTQYVIDMELFDYNDYDGIYKVIINFYLTGDLVANFTFNQYSEPNRESILYTELSDQFQNQFGDYLIIGECQAETVPVGWTEDILNLRLTFRFHPFDADTIEITCIDTENLSAIHVGPFPGSPGFLIKGAVLPLSISGLVAVGGAVLILVTRLKGNKTAKKVEEIIAGR